MPTSIAMQPGPAQVRAFLAAIQPLTEVKVRLVRDALPTRMTMHLGDDGELRIDGPVLPAEVVETVAQIDAMILREARAHGLGDGACVR